MNELKIRIDYNEDPNINVNAKQIVYLQNSEDIFQEIDIKNLIGKTIINVERESFHNCLVLTLVEAEPLDNNK